VFIVHLGKHEMAIKTQVAKEWLRPRQAAKILGIGHSTVLEAIKSGRLRARNVGTGARPYFQVDRDDLEAFERSLVYQPEKTR
jgi:excisionase family DNA binding protein